MEKCIILMEYLVVMENYVKMILGTFDQQY